MRWLLLLLLALPLMAQVPAVPPPQVPFSGTVGPGGKFPFFNGGTITMTDADHTMQFPEFTASVIQLTGTLTAQRTLYAPATSFGFEFTIQNKTNQSVVVKPEGNAAAVGVTIPNGETRMVIFDGTTYVVAGGGGGTGPGGGIQSINGNTNPSQSIVAGAGISVSPNTNGTTTITNTGGGVGAGPDAGQVVFQGVSDAVKDTTCSTTANSNQLTCSDAPFTTCPTGSGKIVAVTNGRTSSYNNTPLELVTTIQSCPTTSTAIMADNATRTSSNTSARWGTDNGPALLAMANAPATAGKNFVIPPGNYLVKTPFSPTAITTGSSIDVYPSTTYNIMGGAHIYWVGPTGCDGNDPACPNAGGGYYLFYLHDPGTFWGSTPDTWAPDGTYNVHIRVDGVIEGGLNAADKAPNYNDSSAILWIGGGTQPGYANGVRDITIDGTGSFINMYGFAIHGIAGKNISIRHLTFDHDGKALNINADYSDQSFNTLRNWSTMESAGAYIRIIGNQFDNIGGINSIGVNEAGVSLGGDDTRPCDGDIVSNNVFSHMTSINLVVSDCPIGAIISNNYFWVGSGTIGALSAINFHDGPATGTSHDNLVVNNTFDGEPDCYADVVSLGYYTGANIYNGNHVVTPCHAAYIFYSGWRPGGAGTPVKPEIVRTDSLTSATGRDILVEYDDVINLQGPLLSANPRPSFPGPNFTADSWFSRAGVGQVWATPPAGGGGNNLPQSPGVLIMRPTQDVGHPIIAGNSTEGGLNLLFQGFTAPANGNVVDCTIYIGAIVPGRVHCFLYDSNAPNEYPGDLLCNDTTGTASLSANSWNKISSIQSTSCPPLVANHKYYIVFAPDSTMTVSYESKTLANPEFVVYSPNVNCCTAPPSVAAAHMSQLPFIYSFYMTMQTTNYTAATTLGTGYLHYDGSNYSWDTPSGGPGAGNAGEVVFQGVSDAVKDSTCSTTAGSPNLTCSDAPFPSPCPNLVDKTVSVTGALQGATFTLPDTGAQQTDYLSLITAIQSCPSSTVAVMGKVATHAITNTTARWGTDNGPALFAQANAPSTQGKTFIVPPGDYLVQSQRGFPGGGVSSPYPHTGTQIDVYPHTSYVFSAGSHIYWIGPTGCSAKDVNCIDEDQGFRLLYIHDRSSAGDTWVDKWGGNTSDARFTFDGIIEGDNSTWNGLGHPHLNQSAVVFFVGGNIDGSSVTDIDFQGTGTLLNMYGFSFHGAGHCRRVRIRGIHHNHVAKGLNVNGNNLDQSYNSFFNSAGIELAGYNSTIMGNRFDNSWGVSIGGYGGGIECPGVIMSGNVFINMTDTNVHLAQCPVGAIISNNTFDIPDRFRPEVQPNLPVAINIHDNTPAGDNTPTRDNLIIGNTYRTHDNCYAAIITYGTATGGNTFVGNKMTGACLYGYVMRNVILGQHSPDIIKNDTLIGTNNDLSPSGGGVGQTVLQGTFLAGSGTIETTPGVGPIAANSWYSTNAGVVQLGEVKLPNLANHGSLGTDPNGVLGPGSGGPGAVTSHMVGSVASGLLSMLKTNNWIPIGQPGCTSSAQMTCTFITPVVDTTYTFYGIIWQLVAGTGTCSNGVMRLYLGWTDPDLNVNPGSGFAVLATAPGIAPNVNLTMNTSTNANNNYFTFLPRSFRAKGGTPVFIQLHQTTASDCTDQTPQFKLRVALYENPW